MDESDFSWPSGCAEKKIKISGNLMTFNDTETVYSLSYNFDDTGNQEGILYYAKIDKIIINSQSKKISELTTQELTTYDESNNTFESLNFKNNYNFADIIKQNFKKRDEVKIPLF